MNDMNKQFFCSICDLTFSSSWEMAQHFRSEEHRDKAGGLNLDSLIEKFLSSIRTTVVDTNNKQGKKA